MSRCESCDSKIKPGSEFVCTAGRDDDYCGAELCKKCAADLFTSMRCSNCGSRHVRMPPASDVDRGRCSVCRQECDCFDFLQRTVVCTRCVAKGKCTKCKMQWPLTKSKPVFCCAGQDCERGFCEFCAKDLSKPRVCTVCGCGPHPLPARNVYGDGPADPGACDCDCKSEMRDRVVCLVCEKTPDKKKPSKDQVIAFLLRHTKQFGSRQEVEAAMQQEEEDKSRKRKREASDSTSAASAGEPRAKRPRK